MPDIVNFALLFAGCFCNPVNISIPEPCFGDAAKLLGNWSFPVLLLLLVLCSSQLTANYSPLQGKTYLNILPKALWMMSSFNMSLLVGKDIFPPCMSTGHCPLILGWFFPGAWIISLPSCSTQFRVLLSLLLGTPSCKFQFDTPRFLALSEVVCQVTSGFFLSASWYEKSPNGKSPHFSSIFQEFLSFTAWCPVSSKSFFLVFCLFSLK